MTDKVVIYQSQDGEASLEVRLEQDTVWLSQAQMAELMDKDTDTIGLHIRNIYKEGELEPEATTEESSVVQNKGGRKVRRKLKFYKLDAIHESPGIADRGTPAGFMAGSQAAE